MFSPFTRDGVNETQKVFFFKLIDYFYFWLHWVFLAVQGLSLSFREQGLLSVDVHRLLTALASLLVEHGL